MAYENYMKFKFSALECLLEHIRARSLNCCLCLLSRYIVELSSWAEIVRQPKIFTMALYSKNLPADPVLKYPRL